MNAEHECKLFEVFKSTLSLSDDIDKKELQYNVTQGWDSIAHMSIVAGLEEAFDCMLDTDDILDMSSYSEAVRIMDKHCEC